MMKKNKLLLGVFAFALMGCGSDPKKSDDLASGQENSADNYRNSTVIDDLDTRREQFKPSAAADHRALKSKASQNQDGRDEARKILSTHPTDAIALNILAESYASKGQTSAAKFILAKALETKKDEPSLYANMAALEFREGNEREAVSLLKKALTLNKSHAPSAALLGSHYARGGQYKKAYALLDIAHQSYPDSLSIATNYALCLRAVGSADEAYKIAKSLLAKHPRDVMTLYINGLILIMDLNQPKDGLPLVRKAKLLETENKKLMENLNELERHAENKTGSLPTS